MTLTVFSDWFSRFALFLVYFWFGILKVVTESPANPLVESLLSKTMPFMGFDTFIVVLGLGEAILGILFLFPKLTKLALVLLALHMVTTLMPMVLLPQIAWTTWFVPTLEGQYMIKNILIIALAVSIASRFYPTRSQNTQPAQERSLSA